MYPTPDPWHKLMKKVRHVPNPRPLAQTHEEGETVFVDCFAAYLRLFPDVLEVGCSGFPWRKTTSLIVGQRQINKTLKGLLFCDCVRSISDGESCVCRVWLGRWGCRSVCR